MTEISETERERRRKISEARKGMQFTAEHRANIRVGQLRRYGPSRLACSIDGCEKPPRSRTAGICEMHYWRLRRNGDLEPHPRKLSFLYRAVHTRVVKVRGPAADHPCADCGAPARHWSYIGRVGFSLSVGDYEPRCCSCHQYYDLAHHAQKTVKQDGGFGK
jgi:hypothetical protein